MTRAGLSGRRGEKMRISMRFVLLLSSATLLALPLGIASAKSGATAHKPNKDFVELIAKGERPEIAACMVATLDYMRHDASFDAVHLGADTSDGAIMRETESNGQMTRSIRFSTKARLRGGFVFFHKWQAVEISCEQREEASPEVHLRVVGP